MRPLYRPALDPEDTRHSKRHHLLLAATNAVIDCYQLTLLNIKLFRLVHFPFMVDVAAQGIALVLFL
jgi:hypothetical protein